jgi:hypothetical protein
VETLVEEPVETLVVAETTAEAAEVAAETSAVAAEVAGVSSYA